MDKYPKKGSDGRWYKPCPSCGEMKSYLRKWYAETSLHQNKKCKKCTQKDTDTNGVKLYEGIKVSWFKAFEKSAIDRGLDFDITIEDVWSVFAEQDFVCALTGWPIGWIENGHHQASTASIDRIDSTEGYVRDNIQIVHKHVNMMKQHYDNEYFIDVCKAVSNNT